MERQKGTGGWHSSSPTLGPEADCPQECKDLGPSHVRTQAVGSPQGRVPGCCPQVWVPAVGVGRNEPVFPPPFEIFAPICSWPRGKFRTPSRSAAGSSHWWAWPGSSPSPCPAETQLPGSAPPRPRLAHQIQTTHLPAASLRSVRIYLQLALFLFLYREKILTVPHINIFSFLGCVDPHRIISVLWHRLW